MSRRKRFTRNLGRRLPAPLPARTTMEWIRFEHVVDPYGLFSYIDEARAQLSRRERAELDELMRWFDERLHAPVRIDRERFWFRAEAEEHVVRARRVMELVNAAGFAIVERSTRRVPGKTTWADVDQVAVLTYRDAPRSKKRPP